MERGGEEVEESLGEERSGAAGGGGFNRGFIRCERYSGGKKGKGRKEEEVSLGVGGGEEEEEEL